MMWAICLAITLGSWTVMDYLSLKKIPYDKGKMSYFLLFTYAVYVPATAWVIRAFIVQG